MDDKTLDHLAEPQQHGPDRWLLNLRTLQYYWCGSVHHHQYTRPSLAWSGGGWTFITARLLHEVSIPRNVYTTTLTEARRG
ncbi:hypothetical protein Pmani_009101 [Petrolisthes manimaculis]|uniref:Uncharacterized protein n=1 Tax=Petrolisthes manimaculis TaxID=1843537 RepID=A0AAE1Q475_9EUCA|nr:hypothetical protein Pmani_009101 [Petrolisthes manimaculis]